MVEESGRRRSSSIIIKWRRQQEEAEKAVEAALEAVSRVKCFGGRWVNIGRKLEQLPWAVSELCSHPLAGRHALCAEQLDAIVATAKQAARLAAACSTPGVAPAKLQMQSDLDAVAARLDLNLHDCSLLLKSSLLLLCDCDADADADDGAGQPQPQPQARPQPRPPQLRDLLARLHIGDSESKERALDALLAAMRSDSDCNANAAVAFVRSSRSSVAALVHLLSAATPRIREKAVTVLCAVLQEEGEAEAEAEAEAAIGPLVRLLESGSPVAREKAAACFRSLTAASPEHTRAVAGHAGVAALVETVAAGASPPQTRRAAAATLLNMAAVAEVRQTLADEGALALMLDSLSLDQQQQQQQLRLAAEFLQNITAGSDELRRTVAAQGGVKQLLRYLEKCDAAAAAPALGALRNLAWVAGSGALLEEGLLLAAVARVLRGPCPAAQQLALSLMCRMCCCSWGVDDVRKQVGESGCMECVIGLLATSAAKGPVPELAAQALAALAVLPANARELRKQHNSRAVIPALVSMLEPWPCGRSAAYKYTIAVLWSLASSKKCRKLMLSLGARIHLKRLSHDDPCAKKLCDRLERPPLSSFLLLTAGGRRFG